MFSFLYTVTLHLLGLIVLPVMLYKRLRYGKYKESFSKRMGMHFPVIDKGDAPLIWVHAISMGETKAIAPLVKLIKKESPQTIILFTNVTETGHKEALRDIPEADFHAYLPFDLPYIIRPIVERIKPNLVVITETDFWFHFQDSVKQLGGKIVVANAKMSPRSLRYYRILPWLTAPLFRSLDLVLAQTEDYRQRFLQLGIFPAHVHVTGNVKLDAVYPELTAEEVHAWKERLGILPHDKVLVIGSTHDPEEKILLAQLKKVWKKFPDLKVLLAPRHPSRFTFVAGLLEKMGIPYALWTRGDHLDDTKRVLLVDTMGQLRGCYQLADIAIVAGSFTDKVGGHNLLEPSWYSKPVIYGPHVHSQLDFAELISQKGAGLKVNEDDVAEVLLQLLHDPAYAAQMGLAGRAIFKEAQGATLKTWEEIKRMMERS